MRLFNLNGQYLTQFMSDGFVCRGSGCSARFHGQPWLGDRDVVELTEEPSKLSFYVAARDLDYASHAEVGLVGEDFSAVMQEQSHGESSRVKRQPRNLHGSDETQVGRYERAGTGTDRRELCANLQAVRQEASTLYSADDTWSRAAYLDRADQFHSMIGQLNTAYKRCFAQCRDVFDCETLLWESYRLLEVVYAGSRGQGDEWKKLRVGQETNLRTVRTGNHSEEFKPLHTDAERCAAYAREARRIKAQLEQYAQTSGTPGSEMDVLIMLEEWPCTTDVLHACGGNALGDVCRELPYSGHSWAPSCRKSVGTRAQKPFKLRSG